MITHDRWQRIKEIFISAQDRPPAERSDYLNEVCPDDPSMREEVEALLTADADNDDFLNTPALEFAEGMLANETSEFHAGQKIGRFEILCSLGMGGMGQIYLAHDENLGRKIALKLISRDFAADPHRVLRFEQEARAASALNHPNVCVIHDVGKTETGRHFIAMEHIQGKTLREQLAFGTLKPLEALQVTLQIGAALASAHAVGIVHRDIKPENIMLRPDGYIKVVDFGLAKLTEVLTEQRKLFNANTQVHTEPNLLMGTVKYMSPEQLREVAIDERTDIWSLGVVLYEMLTGSTPFEARSRYDSITSILASERAELVFPNDVPPKLRKIIKKALEKDCDQRYQTVLKFTADLASLKKELERNAEGYSAVIPLMQPSPEPYGGSRIFDRLKSQALSTADSIFNEIKAHKTRSAIFAGASGVLAVLLLFPVAARVVNNVFEPAPTPAPSQVKEVTPSWPMKQFTTTGTSVSAAISPDGKLVAHAEEQYGKQQLLVTSTTTPGAYSAMRPEDNVKYLGITFSRDSQYLYFTRSENNGPGNLYRVALPGSNPTQIKSGVDSPISLSPQGDRFAFVRFTRGAEYALTISNIDGSDEQILATRQNGDKLSVYGLAWSPDGEWIVCPESDWKPKYHTNLVAFNVKDKRKEVIGRSWFQILQVGWQEDMKSLVISANENSSSPFRLWRINMSDGIAQPITSDVAEYQGVSISGGNIVTVKTTLRWRLWISKPHALQQAKEITSGIGLFGLTWTSSDRIVYASMASNALNISRINPDGSDLFQLTIDAGDNYTPAASADGRYIVFASNRKGPFNLWRMNADDGSDPVQLTFTDGNFYPSCSPDNQWVAFDNQTDSKMSAWKVPLQGGEAIKLSEGYRMPVFSPDSQLIACRYDEDSNTYDVAIFPAQGGEPLRHFKVPKQEWQSVRWYRDSRHLTFVRNDNGYSNIWSYDLDTGAEKQLTNFNSELIYAYAWSPDYKQVACQRGSKTSDVTIITEQ
jgi:serine/threonine protein kinase